MTDTTGGLFFGTSRDLGTLTRQLNWYEGLGDNTNGDNDSFSFTLTEPARVRVTMTKYFGKAFGGFALYPDPPGFEALGRDSIITSLRINKGVVTKELEPGTYGIEVTLFSGEGFAYQLKIRNLTPQPRGKKLALDDILSDSPNDSVHRVIDYGSDATPDLQSLISDSTYTI